jgi:hypothetical protein
MACRSHNLKAVRPAAGPTEHNPELLSKGSLADVRVGAKADSLDNESANSARGIRDVSSVHQILGFTELLIAAPCCFFTIEPQTNDQA